MQKATFPVVGMMCASCSAHVERKLNSIEGVKEASVSLPARSALIEYDETLTSPQQMKDELTAIGYDLIIEADRSSDEINRTALRLLRRRTIMSWIFALAVMSISMGWISVGDASASNQVMLILAALNMVYCGRQFYLSAWRQMLAASANMDSLVAMSTMVSFVFSVFCTFWGESFFGSRGIAYSTYYDASVMVITFVLTGRLLEERAKDSTASALRSLMGLVPKTACVVEGGVVTEVPVATLAVGDVVEVKAGEKVPVDGSVTSGEALVDESMITGEPLPERRVAGNSVWAGTIVRQGSMRFKARQVGETTMLAHIVRMVAEAQGSKAPVQRTVDRIAMVFVPVVMALAVLTFAVWMLVGGSAVVGQALLSAVSVLVVACPCALGLATPTALMVGIGKAAQHNILIKDATALESLCRVDAMVIDKTGTLTTPVKGIEIAASDTLRPDQRETLKPHTREAVEALHRMGVTLHLMSGDKEEAVAHCAAQAGIDQWRSRVMPQDKEDLVRRLQSEGHHVAMVGDGINDSQALAAADVSIAMGQGTDVAIDAAQITLMGTDLRRIPEAMHLSRKTVGMIRQNLFWAFIYNVVCIPLAAGVLRIFGINFQFTPMIASALMACSSVSVVLNSLRLKWVK